MPPSERQNGRLRHRYDAYEDAQIRYPDWRIEIWHRPGCPGVEFFPDATLVLINADVFLAAPEHVYAYAVVHLDFHQAEMRQPGGATREQDRYANQIARDRMGGVEAEG